MRKRSRLERLDDLLSSAVTMLIIAGLAMAVAACTGPVPEPFTSHPDAFLPRCPEVSADFRCIDLTGAAVERAPAILLEN